MSPPWRNTWLYTVYVPLRVVVNEQEYTPSVTATAVVAHPCDVPVLLLPVVPLQKTKSGVDVVPRTLPNESLTVTEKVAAAPAVTSVTAVPLATVNAATPLAH